MSYFQKIKEQYNNNRECERRKIIDFLINKNNSQLKVSKYGGNGKKIIQVAESCQKVMIYLIGNGL